MQQSWQSKSQNWIKLKNKTYGHFCTNNTESWICYDRNISMIQNLLCTNVPPILPFYLRTKIDASLKEIHSFAPSFNLRREGTNYIFRYIYFLFDLF